MTFISEELNRVVAVLVDRAGRVEEVMVGDSDRVYLPDIGRERAGASRFRGIRLIRTNLTTTAKNRQVELTRDDLTDLSRLKLDLVMTIAVGAAGYPGSVAWASLVPENPANDLWQISVAANPSEVNFHFTHFIGELESEFQRKTSRAMTTGGQPAMLVYVATPAGRSEEIELAEMHELCRTAGVSIVDTVVQNRADTHPKYAIGKGKLEELTLRALQLDAELIIFAQDLSPNQLRGITEMTEIKVLDRTQLILDIFAQRATSSDGKVQVELAQLKYSLPRLHSKSTGMSRLTGGIGGRGPGETKLEINRRRARDRIRMLEGQIETLGKQRGLRRERRQQNRLPVVGIVGYTNAGKSTLLNTLTHSEVLSEDKLFATLQPTSRRLRFPDDREIIFTDTVGFIHDLPPDLVAAFKATLEELDEADILLHVVDMADEDLEAKMRAVNRILSEIGLGDKEQLLVFNKMDLLDDEDEAELMARSYAATPICATQRQSTRALVEVLEARLFRQARAQQASEPTHI
ncbi:MAG: GTPase HflX [Bradymonadaceae bacterium]|nr:GTPase HflX [Lujinxingiaceae bacterium]